MKKYLFFILGLCVLFFASTLWADDSTASSSEENTSLAKVMQDMVEKPQCWFCGTFIAFFEACVSMINVVSNILIWKCRVVLGLGIAFVITFRVLKMVPNMKELDLLEFLSEMFKGLGRSIFGVLLLTACNLVAAYLVAPVLDIIVGLAVSVLEGYSGYAFGTDVEKSLMKACRGYLNAANSSTGVGLSDHLKWTLTYYICKINASTLAGMVPAAAAFQSLFDLSGAAQETNSILKLVSVATGGIMFIGLFTLMISVPLRVIDSVLRLAFLFSLMPLFILLWTFPATVNYTKKAWDMFITAVLQLFFLSLIIVLILALLSTQQSAITSMMEEVERADKAFTIMLTDMPRYLIMAGVAWIGYKLLDMAASLAKELGGSTSDLGVGAFVGQASSQFINFSRNAISSIGKLTK